MWSTISLVLGAGRVPARTPAGWRFVPAAEAAGLETWPCRLDPIEGKATIEAAIAAAAPLHEFLFDAALRGEL